MKVAVIGAEGQLGAEVCAEFADADVHRVDLDGDGQILDICDAKATQGFIADDLRPDVVVNTAAYHNVFKCETDPAPSFAVNASGVKNLAVACQACGARLIHISTDYVFGSGGTRPFIETDLPAPLNVYGVSKLAGEHLAAAYCKDHVIVRTAAIFGPSPCRAKAGKSFVGMMLDLARTRPEVKVVTDEITTATYTVSLAHQLRILAEKGDPGLYHATCQGECSWYDFAHAILEETNTEAKLVKATKDDFPSPIQRPEYSVLENKHLEDQGLDEMPPWREGLNDFLHAHIIPTL